MSIITNAKIFAIAAHEAVGQVRKYTGEPYWVHPQEVVDIVYSVTTNSEMLAAAWLHDVVEDTKITIRTINREFGETIAQYVKELTDISRPEMGNREIRKAVDRVWISMASPQAQTIKIADLISNRTSIVKHDPNFAKIYMQEGKLTLEACNKADERLKAKLWKLIGDYENNL